MSSQGIYVSVQLAEHTIPVGRLWFHQRGARQGASFEYDQMWLKHPERFALDPALQLTRGAFHTTSGQILFGSVGDSAPDRWGRVLQQHSAVDRFAPAALRCGTLS